MKLAIFGAQGIALGAYQAIHNLYPARQISCFLVTSKENNAGTLMGLPVLELASFAASLSTKEKEEIEILIATPENVMREIEHELEAWGLRYHIRLTSTRFAELMGYYYVSEGICLPLSALPVGFNRANIEIFMAKSGADKSLTQDYRLPAWITPIQVGAVFNSERVVDIRDCDGENISHKNGNYSELTALYWLWRNRLREVSSGTDVCGMGEEERYFGLCHYRRILDISEDDVLRLADNAVDVVLPYPMPYAPDISMHRKRWLQESDWQALLAAVEELAPEYAIKFQDILRQQYLYNYNIVLARREVLQGYCEWLFPILERVEQLSVPRGWERKDRYIGYMGEMLESLYFMVNRERLNVVHAGCLFLV